MVLKFNTVQTLIYFLLVLQIWYCVSLPLPVPMFTENVEEMKENPQGFSALIPFLKKFGYLGKNFGSATGNISSDHDMLFTQDSFKEAVKKMQKFGALRQTGNIDNETLALLTKPRCGVPDFVQGTVPSLRSKRYVIGASGWNKRRLTYRVENWTPQLHESTILADLRKAFAVWSDYARLRFINKPRLSNDDVDISISFGAGYHGDNYPFDGSWGVLAHAFFPYGHGSLGGDIHFDLDENWSSTSNVGKTHDDYTSGNNVSFFAVAVHEIGHSLGLSHSPARDSVMFPYYQGHEEGNNENVHLGYDDIMAMYQLYIQREIEDFGDSDERHITTTTVPSTTQYIPTSTISYVPDTPTTTLSPQAPFTTTTAQTTQDEHEQSKPDICHDGFDTITFMRKEIFVFKGKYMWRFKGRRETEPFYPAETSRLFPMLANVSAVDAAFENNEGQLVFFSGKYYWIYDGTESVNSGPFSITDFGLSTGLDNVDAAFIWGKNGKLYLFSGDVFWRYDPSNKTMDEGYPKGMELWRGLPTSGIDSVLKSSDGTTYFFKNDEFWRFNDAEVHIDEGYPRKTSTYWFGC